MEIDEQEIMQELEAGPSVKKARVDTSVDTSAQHVAPMVIIKSRIFSVLA